MDEVVKESLSNINTKSKKLCEQLFYKKLAFSRVERGVWVTTKFQGWEAKKTGSELFLTIKDLQFMGLEYKEKNLNGSIIN